jgi:MYXO-CTERM domain-containing protein
MRQRIHLLLAIALVAPLVGCYGQPEIAESQNGIIHGDPVGEDGYPTVGMMMLVATASRNGAPAKRGPLALCTGTLISPTAVLLAAHCVDPDLMNQELQQAGITVQGEIEKKFTYDNSINSFITATDMGKAFVEKPSLLPVASFDQMPINVFGALMRPGQMDDIAVLHLAKPVKGRPVQALVAAKDTASMQTGSLHAVAGYGQTSNDPGDFNGDGTVDPAEASAGTLHSGVSTLNVVGQYEIIAGDMDSQQACRGDSGGPIFLDKTQSLQLGIASRINALPLGAMEPPRCEPGLLYTRVDAYLDWIKQHVSDLGQTPEACAPNDPDPSCPSATTSTPDMATGGTGGNGDNGGSGGCGCRLAAGPSPTPLAILILVGGALLLLRRTLRRRG